MLVVFPQNVLELILTFLLSSTFTSAKQRGGLPRFFPTDVRRHHPQAHWSGRYLFYTQRGFAGALESFSFLVLWFPPGLNLYFILSFFCDLVCSWFQPVIIDLKKGTTTDKRRVCLSLCFLRRLRKPRRGASEETRKVQMGEEGTLIYLYIYI